MYVAVRYIFVETIMDVNVLCRCIPYRYKGNHGATTMEDEDEIEVLVITSQRKGKGMLFPKVLDHTLQSSN